MTRSTTLATIAALGLTLAAVEPWHHRAETTAAAEAARHAPTARDPVRPTARARPESQRAPPPPVCRRLVRDPRKGYVEVATRC